MENQSTNEYRDVHPSPGQVYLCWLRVIIVTIPVQALLRLWLQAPTQISTSDCQPDIDTCSVAAYVALVGGTTGEHDG